MPDFPTAPTPAEIEVTMKSSGYWTSAPEGSPAVLFGRRQTEIAAEAALSFWEHATGFTPWLATEPETMRPLTIDADTFYDTGVVQLEGGIVRLDSVSMNGDAVNLNDVLTEPSSALGKKRPFEWLHFPRHHYWNQRRSNLPVNFEVTALWGFSTTMPGVVYQTLLEYASVKTLSQIENKQSIASLSQDGLTKGWDIVGIIQPSKLLDVWGKEIKVLAKGYERKFV
jgi:hypothetical protein